MPETHDFGRRKKRFLTTFRYPPHPDLRLPLWESGCETRETEEPFRVGYGWSVRIPWTRVALIVGRWSDAGGEEVERLEAALRGYPLTDDADEIRGW